jgi:cellulose synthase/poly-beta-1,6-N-acetylglucosamine synthase-like glycosyltransferase/peptidoglycan/xylan/chitin deacetylase (PgdA/CDA1 family)
MRGDKARDIGRQIERPPAHWGLLALVVLSFVVLLLTQGLSTKITGDSSTLAAQGREGASLTGSAVYKSDGDGSLRPLRETGDRRVALTFDDGPDPRWTREIIEVLDRENVTATFFVTGDSVAQHPEVLEEIHDAGFEIGNHTFSHPNLTLIPDWQVDLQVDMTESAISGAIGTRPRLLRPPYSAIPEAVTVDDEDRLGEIASRGYLIALSDFDSEDWRQPGVERIVQNAIPRGNQSGAILMHDGGGDRSQTVDAVERLIPRLKERGYGFTTVAGLVGLSEEQVAIPGSRAERTRGQLLIGALKAARVATTVFGALLILMGALAVARALLVLLFARRHAKRVRASSARDHAPPVSIIVPAFEESKGIEDAIRSLADSDYPEFEVILVDDGSKDGTGELVDSLALKHVRVIRQDNQGKAAALNRGALAAAHEILVTVDADTSFRPETLARLVEPLADEGVGAVAGNTKVGNRRGLLGRWQHIEYVMAFNLDRRLYDVLECMPTVPGAIGAFRREALDQVGGFSGTTLAEDTDVTIAVGRLGWRIAYAEDAVAYTEVPASLGEMWRQRYRWSFGTIQAVWKHRAALVKREPGHVGRRGLPYLILFQIVLPALAPLVDLFALYGLIFLDPVPVLAAWVGFNLLLLAIGAYAFRLDREPLRGLWAMPLQQFVYRQLMYLVVIQTLISALQGARLRWQHLERTGRVEHQH